MNYYLDYNALHQLYAINYIAEQDTIGTLDTMIHRLNVHYGPAEINQPQSSYRKFIWMVEDPVCSLNIQIMITDRRYAVHIRNQSLAE
jgi:hypothetical protein